MNMQIDIRILGKLCEKYYELYGKRYFWRVERLTPFQVLLVEFLLWKTRAEMVEKYGKSLVVEFKDPEDLLRVPIEAIEQRLKPLGLYKRRSKLLVRIASTLVQEFGGEVPRNVELLLELPGVGPYVATATALFAYGEKCVPVDSNVWNFLIKMVGNVGFSIEDRKYPLRREYIDFSRRFFESVTNPKMASWGLLDLSKCSIKEVVKILENIKQKVE